MDRLTQFNDLPLVPAIIAKQVQAFCRGFVKGVRTNVYRHNLYGHSTSTTQPPRRRRPLVRFGGVFALSRRRFAIAVLAGWPRSGLLKAV